MNRNRLIGSIAVILAILFSLSPLAFAQASSRVVQARGVVSVDAVRPGDRFKVAIVLDIDSGYHINSNNPTGHNPDLDFLIPTKVEFKQAAGLSLGEVKYPPAQLRKFEFSPDSELAVHEGTVIITADAEATEGLAIGSSVIHAKVTVQSCNDTQCLAPSDIAIEIPVKVIAASAAIAEANADLFRRAEDLGYAPP
ncbi:MAG TPA: protein-disulfide reductase DsbD domain-containing protein, partial [Blastocatellia bacterium]|nr:protein-disulfide reductase DsbD domain-containing protein [Blastocatellia bacterium]